MNTMLHEQTARHLMRQVHRWDRRFRLVTSLLWGPRGLILGLLIGLSLTIVSRLRPWLLPEEIVTVTIVVVATTTIGGLGLIWFWPRSTVRGARYFDHRFALRERVSTALEVVAGTIPYPDRLAERQLSDAVGATRKVKLATLLPLRLRFWEILVMAALAGLLVALLTADNPQVDELLAQRDLEEAIDEQAAEVEQLISDIEANPALSQEEQEALTDPLAEALEILEQPDISQQEALAALAEAAQEMDGLSDGMQSGQEAAYQEAASELSGSDMTADLAEAFRRPDLGAAAEALDDMANELGRTELSPEEREQLAQQLEAAAEQLAQSNPALAEKLRQAAEELRQGNIQAAQQTLREAAEMLREQQEQLQNSALSQQANQAQQELNESQQQLAQAGQEQQTGQTDQTQQMQQQSGQLVPQAPSQAQSGQQIAAPDSQQGSEQTGQPGQPTGAEQGQSPSQGENSPGQMAASENGETGELQSSAVTSPSDEGGMSANAGQQPSAQRPGQGGDSGQTQGGSNSPSAGQGEGGAGTDTVTGTLADGEEMPTDNVGAQGQDGIQEFSSDYQAYNIGGQSDDMVNVGGEASGIEGAPVIEGEFGQNPTGESTLSYTGIYTSYQNIVSDALENGRIPLDQRDVIHDYFSSLEP